MAYALAPGPGWRVDVSILPRKGMLHLAKHGEQTLVRHGHAHGGLSACHGRWDVSPARARMPPSLRPGSAKWARTLYCDFPGRAGEETVLYIGLGLLPDWFDIVDSDGALSTFGHAVS